jgi:hypothetical protein
MWNTGSIQIQGGHYGRGNTSLMVDIFLYKNEYRIIKPREGSIRRGLKQKGEK